LSGHSGGGGRERWLITYADMLTLLLAFFIIIYSISKADAQRFKKFQTGMQQAFHLTVLEGNETNALTDAQGALVGPQPSTVFGPQPVDLVPTPTAVTSTIAVSAVPALVVPAIVPVPGSPAKPVPLSPVPTIPNADIETAQKLRVELAGLVPPGSQGDIEVSMSPDGVIVSIYGVLLFDSGVADLRPQGRDLLAKVADSLRPLDYNIRVEGHTDNIQPDGTGPYPTNWELSTARAVTVTHYLADNGQIAASRLGAAGYAEFRPVASNATRDGRLRNRRIDLVLVRTNPPVQGGP
jgi:chemotaxis protein MotB